MAPLRCRRPWRSAMSSSDEPPDWGAFVEREVLTSVEMVSPAAEVAALLQRYRADLETVRRELDEKCQAYVAELASQAVLVVHLASALDRYESLLAGAGLSKAYRHLRVVKEQMLDALIKADVEIVRLQG